MSYFHVDCFLEVKAGRDLLLLHFLHLYLEKGSKASWKPSCRGISYLIPTCSYLLVVGVISGSLSVNCNNYSEEDVNNCVCTGCAF